LGESLDLPEVLSKLCRTGQDVMRADAVFLWTLDGSGQVLESVQVAGVQGAEFLGRRIPVGDRHSIVARVFRTGEPAIASPSRTSRLLDQPLTTMLGAQSVLATPISLGRKTVGVLLFSRRGAEVPFTDRDLASALLLVSQAVFAILNAQHYTEQHRRLEEVAALYEFTHAVSRALSATTIAEELLELLKRRPGYHRARVLLRERDSALLRPIVFDGPPSAGWNGTAAASEVARRAMALGSAVHTEISEPRQRPRLAVPLALQGRVIGVVELEGRSGGHYSSVEEALVVSLANQAALAVDNLQLMEDARKVAALREMNQMKSDLLATVSHELRTPLGSIKGYVSTLITYESKLKRDERSEFLRIIDEESDRLTELIDNLLDMSRLEAGMLRVERRPADLEPVARQAV